MKRRYGTVDAFPIIATTYRVSEHWQTGAMSRNMSWLAGLTPSAFAFVEIGTALAEREGIENGDRVIVSSARGSMEVYALVTERFQPFFVAGRRRQLADPRDQGLSLPHQAKGSRMTTPKSNAMIQDNTRCIGRRTCRPET